MGRDGVDITKAEPGNNAVKGADSTSGLIAQAVASGIELGKVYTFSNIKQAEAEGLDEAYDTDNGVLVYYHLKETFRMAGDGTKVFFMGVPRSLAFADIVQDLNAEYGMKLTATAKGEVRQLAFAFNPEDGYVPSYSSGLDEEVFDCIAAGQDLALRLFAAKRPAQVLIEGRDVQDVSALPNLRALPGLEATKVSLCIGQDYSFAESLDAGMQNHAAIGTLLGSVAKVGVSQSIGNVAVMNLSDTVKSAFTEAGISSHTQLDDIETYASDMDEKGYLFPINYTGYEGFYWNEQHVCAPIIIDRDGVMNEHTISLGRTMDKATRLLRAAYLPYVQSDQPVDSKTGKLPVAIVYSLAEVGNAELSAMETDREISGGETRIDPDSDLFTPPKTLNVEFSIVPYGIIGEIKGTINAQESL